MLEGGSGFGQCQSSLDGEPPAVRVTAALFLWRYTCTQGCTERLHETEYYEKVLKSALEQIYLANCTVWTYILCMYTLY